MLKLTPDEAFGAWLDYSLREQFAAVLAESVPEELRDLIEAVAEPVDPSR